MAKQTTALEIIPRTTQPKPRFPKGFKPNPATLAAGRYGTEQTVDNWGADQTIDKSLRVQGKSSLVLSELHPDIISRRDAKRIARKASTKYVNPDRVREIEELRGHDVEGINGGLEEVLPEELRQHVNRFKTSADTTQPTRALQLKDSLEVIADTTENLRDIVIEKSIEFIDIPHMDQTHLYDALPTVAGRAFAHYAEMLQSGLNLLKFVYKNSIKGKWGDATGNHHQATASGVDGMKLQERFCKKLGIGYMLAPAQLPGLEFEADVVYAVARIGMTAENLARYIEDGFGNDAELFFDTTPKKRKGSTAMPHKDAKGGNRIVEEQVVSMANKLKGWMTTALANCEMPYARTLYASANARIDLEDNFKFTDHSMKRLSSVVFYLGINKDRAFERVLRTYGIVTSSQVMAYLTDSRRTQNPMGRSQAHDLMGSLATTAWETKTQFLDVLLTNPEVTSRLDEQTLRQITNPVAYIGQSKEIIREVAKLYHRKKTLA